MTDIYWNLLNTKYKYQEIVNVNTNNNTLNYGYFYCILTVFIIRFKSRAHKAKNMMAPSFYSCSIDANLRENFIPNCHYQDNGEEQMRSNDEKLEVCWT